MLAQRLRVLRILIIEDEPRIGALLVKVFQGAGYSAELAPTGELGLAAHRASPADLIVLDLMLPGMNGYDVVRTLRPGDSVPVLMLTALGQECHRLLGFDAGVDDYLVKPLNALELLARVKAIFRQGRLVQEENWLRSGPFVLDCTALRVTRDCADLGLSPAEGQVLHVLLQHPGLALTRSEVVNLAWPSNARPAPRVIDEHVASLLGKLARPGDPPWIGQRSGRSYGWLAPVEAAEERWPSVTPLPGGSG
jgi:DNA-binding response OmpR family regulator